MNSHTHRDGKTSECEKPAQQCGESDGLGDSVEVALMLQKPEHEPLIHGHMYIMTSLSRQLGDKPLTQ